MAERPDSAEELRRRYLAQQIEFGGAEVILGRNLPRSAAPVAIEPTPASVASPSMPEPRESEPREPEPVRAAPVATAEGKVRMEQTNGGEAPKWMKGAPAIPGPGLETLPGIIPPDLDAMETLEQVADRIRSTYCCDTLCPRRINAVPGEGNPKARLMLVGEGPGQTEDETGRPFVGAAGNLLNSILEAVDLKREDVFIANVVKCRPPMNRKPLPEEIASCIPYLWRQIALVRPRAILTLGGTAAEGLLGVKKSLGELRNKVHSYGGIPLVCTYHPAALLRNPNWKKPTWDDVRIARQLIDR